MPDSQQIGRCLSPLAIGSALGVVGNALATGVLTGSVAATAAPLPAAAVILGQVLAGLALNYASSYIAPIVGAFSSRDWKTANYDLDRVARRTLLHILCEVLIEQGTAPRTAQSDVTRIAQSGLHQLQIFEEAPSQADLIEYLKNPHPLPAAQAETLAHAILSGQNLAISEHTYASAIQASFSRTFEILLRDDERAFRAATIYLERHSLHVTDRILELLASPQPPLERFEVYSKKDTAPERTDLQFPRRASRYRFRKSDETRLRDWLNSSDPFRILKITGPAGMGKSRLALQLCDACDPEQWLAGFIGSGLWPPGWTPTRNTLAVLDYAASKSVGGQPAATWLESIYNPSRRWPKVRIVLIDRNEQGPLWTSLKSTSFLKHDLNKLTLRIALEADREEFDDIVHAELVRRLHCEPSARERDAVQALIPRLRGQFRPLFAMLAAAVVAENPDTHNWSPELLIESILITQLRQWKLTGLRDEHLDLLFEATLTQGQCNSDPDFAKRLEALKPEELASLKSLSQESSSLGPIMPDLLGEFFILMRLRGQVLLPPRQQPTTIRIAHEFLGKSLSQETGATYASQLLEDFLSWIPEEGQNPAIDIMNMALETLESRPESYALRYCCFVAAQRRPWDRDWAEWLQGLPEEAKTGVCEFLSIGLFNATVDAPNPAERVALTGCIETLHDRYGHEFAVRKQLADAIMSASVVEPDSAKRLALADRIDTLHEQFEHESAVRERLAEALVNATVTEPDPAKRLALADRIDTLHEQFEHESAVRERLAEALVNATVTEPDPAKRVALADRIDALHEQFEHESAVREPLAKALGNASLVEPDPAKRLALANRIETLHEQYGHEPAVRELLAKALTNACLREPDPTKSFALANRIETLHHYGHEGAIRNLFGIALFSATIVETDPAKCLALANRIETLHEQYGHEPAVRELLAKALTNACLREPDPTKSLVLANRIENLHEQYGHEPAVRELLAKALMDAIVHEPDLAKRLTLASRIDTLHEQQGKEAAVREQLAKALINASLIEPDPAKHLVFVNRIETLHHYGHEGAIRNLFGIALFSATIVETDPAKCLALANRIETLHEQYGHEPAVRELLAQALTNACFREPDPTKSLVLANRIENLHEQYGHEPAVRELLAKALANTTLLNFNPAKCIALVDRIEALYRRYGEEPAVRTHLANALRNAAALEPDPATRAILIERLATLSSLYPGEPALTENLTQAKSRDKSLRGWRGILLRLIQRPMQRLTGL